MSRLGTVTGAPPARIARAAIRFYRVGECGSEIDDALRAAVDGSQYDWGRRRHTLLNGAIEKVLADAYLPCAGFSWPCTEMRWIPNRGHIPRGFAGATGKLADIKLVLVFAEPGNPLLGEAHTGLRSAYDYAMTAFRTGRTPFHRNVRYILDSCWPDLTFDQQMGRVWLTESVLCSAIKEGGAVRASTVRECGQRYLSAQLALIPQAFVVALGSKAKARLHTAGIRGFLEASAVAPPGCNFAGARESWDAIAAAVQVPRDQPR